MKIKSMEIGGGFPQGRRRCESAGVAARLESQVRTSSHQFLVGYWLASLRDLCTGEASRRALREKVREAIYDQRPSKICFSFMPFAAEHWGGRGDMNQVAKTQLRWMLGIAVLVLSTLFWLIALRFISIPFLVASWVLFFRFKIGHVRAVLSVWAVWLALSFSPVDVYPIPKGVKPRLVPLVMGLPKPETVDRAKRGDVILGGCIVSGFEPKYYLVW